MLQKLHIHNYAIIDKLEINFAGGLNIITGETGAGKSIVMGALNLILGQRAESSILQQQNQKCVVEGIFTIKNNAAIKEFLQANELDVEDEIILRREVNSNGKSRSFINDTPVNLAQLKELSVWLVDLHQQFDTLELSNENFQREVIDALAGNAALLLQLKAKYGEYSFAKSQLENHQQLQAHAAKEQDYNKYLFDELEELSLQENELENLDKELKLLSNAENVKQQLSALYFELKDSEQPMVQQLKTLQHKLKSLQAYHPAMDELHQRISATVIELQDVAEELESIDQGILYDAERIQKVNDRLSAGYKLLKKHGVNDTQQLLAIQSQLQQKLESIVNLSAAIDELEKQTTRLLSECKNIAGSISKNRQAQLHSFTQSVNKLLLQVGMPNARLKVQMQPSELSQWGADKIDFLFDANKSDRFEPLHKVASGGELSRLMLSVKSLVAKKLQLPTLIFDEIDTGISGEAAKQVGIIMQSMAATHQLIAITHQPQIAAKATAHYFVYKHIVNDKIVTAIKLLSKDERIVAIAKMLSGEQPTAAALENAKEMMN